MTHGFGADLLRRALGDFLAIVKDHDPLGDVHHQLHVVLDEEDRQVKVLAHAAEKGGQFLCLPRVHAGRRLVEEKQPRPRGQGAGDLQPALGPVREVARRFVQDVLQADVFQQGVRFQERVLLFAPHPIRLQENVEQAGLQAGVHGDEHVFEHRQPAEEANVLERAGNAAGGHLIRAQAHQRAAVKADLAAVGLVDAGDEVESCFLPSAFPSRRAPRARRIAPAPSRRRDRRADSSPARALVAGTGRC